MDFSLTEEHLLAQKMVRDFAQKEIYPTLKEFDRRQELNPKVLPRLAELGILGINIPVRYGGQGSDSLALVLGGAGLERAAKPPRASMPGHLGLGRTAPFQGGHDGPKQKLLVPQGR